MQINKLKLKLELTMLVRVFKLVEDQFIVSQILCKLYFSRFR